MKFRATFIGTNSFGYKKGFRYEISVKDLKVKRLHSQEDNNEKVYLALESFLSDWEDVERIEEISGGEVSIEFNFIPQGSGSTYKILNAELSLSGPAALITRRIEFPDGSVFEFNAFLTGLESEDPLDDKMTGTGTFKISGEPVLIQAS